VQGQGATGVAVVPGWRSRQLQLGMDFRSGRRNDRVGALRPRSLRKAERPVSVQLKGLSPGRTGTGAIDTALGTGYGAALVLEFTKDGQRKKGPQGSSQRGRQR